MGRQRSLPYRRLSKLVSQQINQMAAKDQLFRSRWPVRVIHRLLQLLLLSLLVIRVLYCQTPNVEIIADRGNNIVL